MSITNFMYILTTAIGVSLDSFFAGFAMGVKHGKGWALPICTAIATAIMCIITSLIGAMLNNYVEQEWLNIVGAVILLCVGLYNLISAKQQSDNTTQRSYIKQAIIVGIAVALDASIACMSLTMMDFSPYVITPLFAITHFATVALGQYFATFPKIVNKLQRIDWLGGAILIILAFIKIV